MISIRKEQQDKDARYEFKGGYAKLLFCNNNRNYPETVRWYDLCPNCIELLDKWLENPDNWKPEDCLTTVQQDIYKAVLGLDAPENALTTVQEMNEKAKEVVDIMNDCPKKCEGRTCFEAFNREDYKGCPNLIHKIDDITKQHKFHCTEKHVTIGFTVDAFINKCKTIMPRDFKEEK